MKDVEPVGLGVTLGVERSACVRDPDSVMPVTL
jgi:hypothetical protein